MGEPSSPIGAVGLRIPYEDSATGAEPHCSLLPIQENRMMQHTVHALQSELDNLRADNIKLYEKIKFLQSYPGRVSAAGCPPVGLAQTGRPQTPHSSQ